MALHVARPEKTKSTELIPEEDRDDTPVSAAEECEEKEKKAAGWRSRILGLSTNDRFITNFYFLSWFALNVIITLYSKAAFSVIKFPYPMLMTCVHMIFTAFGCQLCAWVGLHTPTKLSRDGWKTVLWFSLVFTANIWLSNASLMMVSVNLHQVVRTTIPLFTMVTSLMLFRERYPLRLLPSVIIVIVGVSVTAWGNMDTTTLGLVVVLSGCFLSSLKGILTQKTQMGAVGLNALDLLRVLSPLATVQLLTLDFFQGEIRELAAREDLSWTLLFHLSVNGIIAFLLNFTSFRSAALLNPLTLNIAGNVKQVLTSLLGIWMFGGSFSFALLTGIVGTAVGAAWYSLEMNRWKTETRRKQQASTDIEIGGETNKENAQ